VVGGAPGLGAYEVIGLTFIPPFGAPGLSAVEVIGLTFIFPAVPFFLGSPFPFFLGRYAFNLAAYSPLVILSSLFASRPLFSLYALEPFLNNV
jgi:hypothetical protein